MHGQRTFSASKDLCMDPDKHCDVKVHVVSHPWRRLLEPFRSQSCCIVPSAIVRLTSSNVFLATQICLGRLFETLDEQPYTKDYGILARAGIPVLDLSCRACARLFAVETSL